MLKISIEPFCRILFSALHRFPFVILAGLTGAMATVLMNHSDSEVIDANCARVVSAAIFALPLLIAAVYADELFPRARWIFQGLALFAVLLHWRFLAQSREEIDLFVVWVSAVSVASMVPGLVAMPQSNWWRVNIGALNAVILGGILTATVLVGFLLAVASVEMLFDLKLSGFHLDVISVCGFLIAPLAVTILLPVAGEELNARQPGFALWGRLCQWALVPIGFLFSVILAAYAVRILLAGHLPDGMVALPVLSLGCYGLAALLILEPWREDKTWAMAFSRIFPVGFPLFSILLFVALERRIRDYGFTFERYMALAIALWIVACCIAFLLRRTVFPAFVPGLLAVMALIAIFGPFSSQEVCLRSQSAILENLLSNRSQENVGRIASSLEYIANNYDQATVERFTGSLELNKKASKYEVARAARKKLNLPESNYDGSLTLKFQWPAERSIPIEGYRLLRTCKSSDINLAETTSSKKLTLRFFDKELAAYADGKKLHTFDLSAIDPKIAEAADAPPGYIWNFENREFFILIIKAEWAQKNDAKPKLNELDFIVLEK